MKRMTRFIIASLFLSGIFMSSALADITGGTHYMLSGATTAVVGDTAPHVQATIKTVEVSLNGTGAVTATVTLWATNIRNNTGEWVELFTVDLTGTNNDAFGRVIDAPWQYFRAELVSITGTSATVDVVLGV